MAIINKVATETYASKIPARTAPNVLASVTRLKFSAFAFTKCSGCVTFGIED
ncbi:hypothetical protein PspKH34_18080 [Parageobacillus sp. KH3-4]|nr:hypothetical protein PspKH34_18080 [Parageobacillus sp. KH3-4]